MVNISNPVLKKLLIQIVPSVPITSSRKSKPPLNVQLTSNCPMAPFSYFTSPMAWSSASIGFTCVSAQHITSMGLISFPIYDLEISTQWQPRSNIQPPPACSISQNQSLWGPGCVSRDFAHKILPTAPSFTDWLALMNLGVYTRSSK